VDPKSKPLQNYQKSYLIVLNPARDWTSSSNWSVNQIR